jgi:hypothetical protein
MEYAGMERKGVLGVRIFGIQTVRKYDREVIQISSIRAYFGIKCGSGSQQVAGNRELQLTFLAISCYQDLKAKMAYLKA